MKRSLTLAAILLILPCLVFAQVQESKNRAGSAYSSIALGDPLTIYSPATAGMGLTGVGLYDTYTVNSANPALWGVGSLTQGVIAFDFQRLKTEDGADTGMSNRLSIDQFQLVLPVVRSYVGLSFGFLPATTSNFSLGREGSFSPDGQPIDFFNRVIGSGGVNRAEAGVGFRITDKIAVGYGANLYFASFEREHNLEFNSADFNRIFYTEMLTGSSWSHRFGLFLRTAGLISERDEISFGATITLPAEIGIERELSAFRNIRGTQRFVELTSESDAASGVIELPLEFNLGLTYTPNHLFSFSTEYLQQRWGEARYSFHSTQEQYLTDRSRMGIGTQFHPYRGDGASGFLSRFKYSLGVTHDSGHLTIGGEDIQTLMFHAGLGILSQRTLSSVDLSFQIGSRGANTQNQMKEMIWGLKLSLNLAERMFVPPMFQ